MIFVESRLFLSLSKILSCSRIFDISVNSSGFFWYAKTDAKGCLLLCF